MKRSRYIATVVVFLLVAADIAMAKRSAEGPLTPIRNTTKRSGYTIDTVGDTLGQASPQNTRLIIKIYGSDAKPIKPDTIVLVDKGNAPIRPVFREDRKVGNEENTGLPLTVGGGGGSSGYRGAGVGLNLNKLLGPKGEYAYTKVDWPKSIFTADKKLQIVLPGGQAFVLPLTSLAK